MKIITEVLTPILLIAMTSCFSTHEVKYPQASPTFQPKSTYDAKPDKVWKAVNDALDSNRIAVVSSDQAAGRIQTDTVAGENFVSIVGGGTMFRYSYNIRITPGEGGKTKLSITFGNEFDCKPLRENGAARTFCTLPKDAEEPLSDRLHFFRMESAILALFLNWS